MVILWAKVLHLLFVIAWMAGIFYLPRIYVHYVDGVAAGQDVRRLVIMAEKLFGFTTLMAVIALASGSWLWFGWWLPTGNWLIAKLGFVVLLIAYHVQCYRYLKQLRAGQLTGTSLYFRVFNEVPLFILIAILILVVLKPQF